MNGERKIFTDSIVPLPSQPGDIFHGMMVNAMEPHHADETMSVLFSFSLPKDTEVELESRVARGDSLSPEELTAKYSPSQSNVESLESWLKQQGFQIEQVSGDGTSIYARATVDQISKSLAVKMVRVTKDGITYSAASDPPSLPANVAQGVQAILGLQPFRRANKHARFVRPKKGNRAFLTDDGNENGGQAHGFTLNAINTAVNIDNAPPYLVSEILRAYGVVSTGLTGRGQKIAILIDTFPHDDDLVTFWNRNGLATTLQQIEKINVSGGPLPVPEGEETLDIEWTSGVAPDSTIRIYASGSLSFVALDRALDRIIADVSSQPGMRQLSISLGLGEAFMGGPSGEVAVQHQKFLRLAALGVNVFVSSGDAGSNPDGSGHSSGGPLQAEYASSDSFVIGVGGTSLRLGSNGNVAEESGWVGSGGGKSIFFARPAWQSLPEIPAGNERLVPDVSAAADPNQGAYLVFQGAVTQIGGTSWSAPLWAGFCALINQARGDAGMPPLAFLPPLIYPLSGTACFRDIVQGGNGEYRAGGGYDLVTGIGVPNVGELVRSLARPAPAA